MAELDIHIRITPRVARWGMAAACLCLMVMVVSPEDITLDTYYPAPTGVYTNMITTGNTTLARDNSSEVFLGTSGVKTNPSNSPKMQIYGDGGSTVDLAVNGQIQTGDGAGVGAVYFNSGKTMGIGQTGNNLGLTNGGGWNFQMNQNGNVGIGTPPSANAELAVIGNVGIDNTNPQEQLDVTGSIRTNKSCAAVLYTAGGPTKICPGTEYVTLVAGIYSPTIETNAAEGYALCCQP